MAKTTKKRKKKKSRSPTIKWIDGWGSVVIGILALAIYANTIGHEFVLDDAIVITENSFTQQGLGGLKSIFSYDTFRGFFQEAGKEDLVAGGRYRPLTHAMFALEYALFGNNPLPGHVINVLLYCLLCVLIYRVLVMMFKDQVKEASLLAFATALLFTCHPVHTEVVANIKSRDEIMSMLCGFGALYFMLCHFQKPSAPKALAGASLFFLALLAKEVAVTFLILIPLAGILLQRLSIRTQILRSWPLLVSFALYMILRISVLGWGFGSEPPTELMNNPFMVFIDGSYQPMAWMQKTALVLLGLGKYLQLCLLPMVLSYDYYPRYFDLVSMVDWRVIITVISYVALIAFALLQLKRNPLRTFAIAWYLIPLVLVANIFFPIGTHLSERFLFMPSLGVTLLLASLLHQWYGKSQQPRLPILVVVLLTLCGSVHSIARNSVWKSNYTLFTQDVLRAGQSAKARNSAAGALIERSITEDGDSKQRLLKEAKEYLEEAIQIHPHYKNAHLLLGNAHLYLNNYEAALTSYNEALSLDPNYDEALNNQAVAYREYGKYWGEEKQDIDQAIKYLLLADAYLKQDFETIRLLGVAYGNNGNPTKAAEYFEKAHEISPSSVVVLRSLQTVYNSLGQQDRATYYQALAEKEENR